MLETMTYELFAPHAGETFRLYANAGDSLDVELIEVTPLNPITVPPASQGAPRRLPFSLVFRGPREMLLPQHIYRIEHEQLGSFELFIVPIGPDQAGMRYEAIFT
jgi:hypothetical protein